jgi:hypothetical protein
MPFSAERLLSYCSLRKTTSAFPAFNTNEYCPFALEESSYQPAIEDPFERRVNGAPSYAAWCQMKSKNELPKVQGPFEPPKIA